MAQAVNDSPMDEDKERAQEQRSDSRPLDFDIKGRFARYASAFSQIILPFLSVRYLLEGLDNILDFNHAIRHWHEPVPVQPRKKELLFGKIPNEGVARWFASNILTISFGTIISGVMAYYTNRTYKDIQNLYREALSYELNKDPKDITYRDMVHSKNKVINTTNNALVKRSLLRFGTAFSFFVPWGLLNHKKYKNTNQLDNVGFRMGTGVVGGYLFSDGFTRRESFFEALQTLADSKINHVTSDPYGIIEGKDIEHLLYIQNGAQQKSYRMPAPASKEAFEIEQLATDIATALNKTYNNTPNSEKVDFTIGKFVYLFGHGLLDAFPQSLAYVELAGKSRGVDDVKNVAEAISSGMAPADAFAPYGITLGNTAQEPVTSIIKQDEGVNTKFADRVTQAKSRIPTASRSPQEFAMQQGNTTTSVSQ